MKGNKHTVLRYTLCLYVKHPTMDPKKITDLLGLEPYVQWMAGEQRRTPVGTVLPGKNRETYWTYVRRKSGEGDFAGELSAFIEEIKGHARFLRKIPKTGGSVMIVIHLPGDINIGGVIDAHCLSFISSLGASLGIEVFPNFNQRSEK